jgi:hypothetical protein
MKFDIAPEYRSMYVGHVRSVIVELSKKDNIPEKWVMV